MEVITNHHWRPFKYYQDFSEKEQNEIDDSYDWMSQEERETADWIEYRNRVYCTQDFMADRNDRFPGWHGYLTDSFFSGLLIKLSDCGDAYKIALMLS